MSPCDYLTHPYAAWVRMRGPRGGTAQPRACVTVWVGTTVTRIHNYWLPSYFSLSVYSRRFFPFHGQWDILFWRAQNFRVVHFSLLPDHRIVNMLSPLRTLPLLTAAPMNSAGEG